MDLSPAAWIWLPSQRCLPNTFVLFRRDIDLDEAPQSARALITADSRYRLTVNGERVQNGPAPCDPRDLDVDPVDLAPYLRPGKNVIGAEVLFYGHGDGTWALGRAGFLFSAEIVLANGQAQSIVSDESWLCCLNRAYRPGQYKRWFLRALQEDFDARLHPFGWDTPSFVPNTDWLPAMRLPGKANESSLASGLEDYLENAAGLPGDTCLSLRTIPAIRERLYSIQSPTDTGVVAWKRDPRDWYEFRIPDSFDIHPSEIPFADSDGAVNVPACPNSRTGHYLTFKAPEQMVGWPYFTIDAPEGTEIELAVVEGHDPAKTAWLDSYIYCWTRFTCKEGLNRFEAFDYESFGWFQLHIHNASRPVTISDVGIRRRSYPWPNRAYLETDDPAIAKLFAAAINTLENSSIETCCDGMGRERQQYSGDVSHQLHAVRNLYGEYRHPARFLKTFGQGMTLDGYFLDTWPGYDRLARITQRQVGATSWGPLLDHGVGFVFDNWNHYMETGDLDAVEAQYPNLVRFAQYLAGIRRDDGLLPVENTGVPAVWIDHNAYKRQRDKQCAFNLYVAAMLRRALAPLARAFGDDATAAVVDILGVDIEKETVTKFWCGERRTFVVNLPWTDSEEALQCDRSLANAILFDQCPDGDTAASLESLVECPATMGFSYPANAGWRLWALAKLGRADIIVDDFRTRWTSMMSIDGNNTLQEDWVAEADASFEWSHCAVAPIYCAIMDLAGIRATEPGFAKVSIRPQLADLPSLKLTAQTPHGPILFDAKRNGRGHDVIVDIPVGCQANLTVPASIGDGQTESRMLVPGENRFTVLGETAHRQALPSLRPPVPKAEGL